MSMRIGLISFILSLCATFEVIAEPWVERYESRWFFVGDKETRTPYAYQQAGSWRDDLALELYNKIQSLEIYSKPEGNYLVNFTVNTMYEDKIMPVKISSDLWKSNQLLQVIESIPKYEDNVSTKYYYLRSKIYLGALKGRMKVNTILINSTIRTQDFDLNSKPIILVTLYALAQDAINSRKANVVVCSLLAEARTVADNFLSDKNRSAIYIEPRDAVQIIFDILSIELKNYSC